MKQIKREEQIPDIKNQVFKIKYLKTYQNKEMEVIWSKLIQEGQYESNKGNHEKALVKFLEAYELNPKYLDACYYLGKEYRIIGKQLLGYLFIKIGLNMPKSINPVKNNIKSLIKDYEWLYELSILAFYLSKYEEGREVSDKIKFNPEVPLVLKEVVHNNYIFYVDKLNYQNKIDIPIKLPLINNSNKKWNPLNPSIIKEEQGYILNCRTVNYVHVNGNYTSMDQDKIIRTRNFLIKLDSQLKVIWQKEIIDDLDRPRYPKLVVGLEDCRLVKYNNKLWFTTTTYDTHEKNIPKMSLAVLSNIDTDNNSIKVENLTLLTGPDPNRCEKNWLPFNYNNHLLAIYGFHPFTLFDLHDNCSVHLTKSSQFDFSGFRGSAGPINFDNGFLTVVHEVIFTHSGRIYLHRFVWLDQYWNPSKISYLFYFDSKGVEYCSGMCNSHNDSIYLTVGLNDSEAFIYELSKSSINQMLHDIVI